MSKPLKIIFGIVLVGVVSAYWIAQQTRVIQPVPIVQEENMSIEKFAGGEVVKTDAEWKEQLTPEQFKVTRKKGTERAFSGEYDGVKTDGVYRCVCCDLPLFDAKHKFDSGTGWPSFFQPIVNENVKTEEDRGFFSVRTEVLCPRCDSHLGHVFDDGPQPTGLRYCMNSAALKLEARE